MQAATHQVVPGLAVTLLDSHFWWQLLVFYRVR